jgi:hypothetical protein
MMMAPGTFFFMCQLTSFLWSVDRFGIGVWLGSFAGFGGSFGNSETESKKGPIGKNAAEQNGAPTRLNASIPFHFPFTRPAGRTPSADDNLTSSL